MTRNEIIQKLHQTQVAIVQATKFNVAHKELFDACCFAGDSAKADEHRAAMHVMLDEQLDQCAIAMTLSRSLLQMPE